MRLKKFGKVDPEIVETLAQSKAEYIKGRSLWGNARKRFFANKQAVVSLIVLCLLLLLFFISPLLCHYSYREAHWSSLFMAPSSQYWFGTDGLGRDLFVRTMEGGQITVLIGVVATIVSIVIGVIYGAVAGMVGGRVDEFMMRIVDILYSLPFLFLVILLMTFFGRDFFLMFVAIGAISWLDMARIVRGQTLALKQKEFIEAARVNGVRPMRMIMKHVIPNLLGIVIIYATLLIPTLILTAAFLSFLGLGVQAPMTSLGVLVSDGAKNMENAWWLLVFPAFFLSSVLYSFNFIGDGLRDALDPKER